MAGRLNRVSRSDELDVSSAQYFANSSFVPVLLLRRRLKSLADVLKGIRGMASLRPDWLPCVIGEVPFVVMAHVGLCAPWSPPPLICTVFCKWVLDAL